MTTKEAHLQTIDTWIAHYRANIQDCKDEIFAAAKHGDRSGRTRAQSEQYSYESALKILLQIRKSAEDIAALNNQNEK